MSEVTVAFLLGMICGAAIICFFWASAVRECDISIQRKQTKREQQ